MLAAVGAAGSATASVALHDAHRAKAASKPPPGMTTLKAVAHPALHHGRSGRMKLRS
jgi:hypothetical protein